MPVRLVRLLCVLGERRAVSRCSRETCSTLGYMVMRHSAPAEHGSLQDVWSRRCKWRWLVASSSDPRRTATRNSPTLNPDRRILQILFRHLPQLRPSCATATLNCAASSPSPYLASDFRLVEQDEEFIRLELPAKLCSLRASLTRSSTQNLFCGYLEKVT